MSDRTKGAKDRANIEEFAVEVLKKHAKSFRAASLFLSSRMRRDAAIAYAFCRYVDDLVDETEDRDSAHQALDELTRMLRGEVGPSPLVSAYLELARRRDFGLAPAEELIKGVRSDLSEVRVRDDEELFLYCYRVAGTVGLMMCGILGVRDPRAKRYAVDLGIGMQLSNICRDVLEDARRGRVYLPESRLAQAGLSQEELLSLVNAGKRPGEEVRERVALVVKGLLLEAENSYESARSGYDYIPAKPRLAIMIAADLYRQIGVVLRERRGSDPLLGRVSVGAGEKVQLCVRATAGWLRGLIPASFTLPRFSPSRFSPKRDLRT